VSALRLALGQEVRDADSLLQTIRPGYVLSADRASVDATEFAGLMTRARQAKDAPTATRMLGEALALWRGPAFAGLDSPVLRAAGKLLNEQRVLAVEAKASTDLGLGHFDVVVADLPRWLDHYPFRERLRALLMVALHQHGCRADALRLYRAGQQRMLRELGLQPSSRLQSVYHAILADARPAAQGSYANRLRRAAGDPKSQAVLGMARWPGSGGGPPRASRGWTWWGCSPAARARSA
jgi:DNA-binding SARP family transcriptional activator